MNPTSQKEINAKIKDEEIKIITIEENTLYAFPIKKDEEILFTSEGIKDRFDVTLEKWFGFYESFKFVLEPYFNIIYNQNQSIQNQFLNLIQVFEGLFRNIYRDKF